jgi:hypothetical protein
MRGTLFLTADENKKTFNPKTPPRRTQPAHCQSEAAQIRGKETARMLAASLAADG